MTAALTPRVGRKSFLDRPARSRTLIWVIFILTNFYTGYQNLTSTGDPMGDVIVQYKDWASQADYSSFYVGIDKPWVYPIVALLPMVLAGAFGFANYAGAWLGLVFVLNLIAFSAMVGWRRARVTVPIVGWWWIAFLFLLGPISLGRIDSISVPIAIVGVLFLASRPRLAAFLLTIATWIKVWPAAIIVAALVATKSRLRIGLTAIVTSAVIIGVALALGAGSNVFSFVTKQSSRGLQVESPVSTIWMWMAFAHVPGAFPYYDLPINTFEVTGPDAQAAAALMTPLLAVVVLVVILIGVVAVQRGATVTELLAPLSLALVAGFVGFNKVGSPQYMTWFAVPIILGLATNSMGRGRTFIAPAVIGLLTAGLTQVFYPVAYEDLLYLNLPLLIDLTVRNILVLVLFGWSVAVLVSLTRPFRVREELADTDAWLPTSWPFQLRPTRERVDSADHAADIPAADEDATKDMTSASPTGKATSTYEDPATP